MLTTQQETWLEAGMVNFNTGRFWHAHEDWEDLWKSLKGVASQEIVDGVQGLIQLAAMLLNHERGKGRGVNNLWTKSSAKLRPVMDGLLGIDVSGLYSQCEPFHQDVEAFALEPRNVRIERQD
jgi:predicted metal-dependent hydrolase